MEPVIQGQSSHPLNQEHYDLLNNVLQGCAVIDQLISQCQQASLNVDTHVRKNYERRKLATGIKQQFFPNHP